jgi:hypothetical protein
MPGPACFLRSAARPGRRALVFCAAALLYVLCLAAGAGEAQTPERRVTVLAAPGLRAEDLTRPEMLSLRLLVARSTVGWMNTRTARVPGQRGHREPEAAAWLTLGSGSRAAAPLDLHDIHAPGAVNRLRKINAALDHEISMGALGELLRPRSGTAVVGGTDGPGPRNTALLFACDWMLHVPVDRSDAAFWAAQERLSPFGFVTDVAALQRVPTAGLNLLVFGDLDRADRYAPLCLPAVAARHRARALKSLDAVVHQLTTPALNAGDLFILIAPRPAASAHDMDRLAPVLFSGEGYPPGLLASRSTHVPGLMANTDLLPTIAAHLRLPPLECVIGRAVTGIPLEALSVEDWGGLHAEWLASTRQKRSLGGLPGLEAALVLGGMLGLAVCRTRPRAGARISAACALVVLALPLLQFTLPAAAPETVSGAAALFACACGLVALVGGLQPARAAWGVAFCGLLVVLVELDLLFGGPLMRRAWMGYSLMDGARYYGIGNEYAGAALGAAFCAVSHAYSSARVGSRWGALIALVMLALFVGAPEFGADGGGMAAVALATAVAALTWWRGQLRGRHIGCALLAAVAALAAVALLDAGRPGGGSTHLGRALLGGDLWNLALRKAALNGWLFLNSPWTLALLGAAAGLASLWRREESALRRRVSTDLGARGAAAGFAAGFLALLLVNDSGVVAGAQCLLMGWGYAMALQTGEALRSDPVSLAPPPRGRARGGTPDSGRVQPPG